MMNIIDFVKEFEFKKRRRLRSWGGAKICSGGCGRIAAPPLKPPLLEIHILDTTKPRQTYPRHDKTCARPNLDSDKS